MPLQPLIALKHMRHELRRIKERWTALLNPFDVSAQIQQGDGHSIYRSEKTWNIV